jgi:L-lactate dehydrogenase
MNELKPKVSIIGAGSVGIRYAYALMMSGLARQIVIVDIDKKRLEGEVMDLSHGAPYISPVDISAGDYQDIVNSDLIVITAGKKQAQNQTRIDLVKENAGLFKKIIPEIIKYAPSGIILVVSNPVDILSYVAWKVSGKPVNHVIGSGTVLDTARFRFLLAKHCMIDPHNVHAYILGEHGDTEFPIWSSAMIGGVLFKDYCNVCGQKSNCDHQGELNNIFLEVRDSAYKIIEHKGETSYGIGLALVRITQAILHNENAILPVSFLVKDFLGIEDIYLSLPAVVNRDGVREVLNIEFSEEEKGLFKASGEAVKKIIREIGF